MSAQRYLVTARKYRPQVFDELVAQEHVTETLKNAIRLDRLAHAYLFSGPRGVGKTTAARILAKAINCTTPLDERGGDAEPCRSCESCKTFEEGRSLNIIEIDAASNNRVDDIRELRETVRIPPQGGRKKVYIVDEVHMLSTAAFNALLKTLEEPPEHVLFIFATTEPHKVLPTILSRCQRFDFRRISVPEIVSRLTTICEEEHITADEASLMLIARKGDGALRDALSVFDQAVSLCGSDLTYPDLAQALGVVDVDLYFDVTDHVIDRSAAGMLHLVERTVRSGHDIQEFIAGLAEHLRNLLVAHTMDDTSLIEAAESTRRRYEEAASRFTEADLLRLLTLAANAEEGIKGSTQPRLKLETALLKMASITLATDLREALNKIDRLEELARDGKLPSGGSSAPDGGGNDSGATQQSGSESASAKRSGSGRPSAERRSSYSGSQDQPQSESASPGQAGGSAQQKAAKSESAPKKQVKASPDPSDAAASTAPPPPVSASPRSAASEEQASAVLGKPALKRKPPTSSGGEQTVTATAVAEPSDAGPIDRIWETLLEMVKNDKIQVWSLLHHTHPEGYDDGHARIAVPNDFHRRVLASQEAYVLEHIRPLADVPIRALQFVVREEIDAPDAKETASEFDPYEYMQRKRQENPVIRAIFEQFGGELVW